MIDLTTYCSSLELTRIKFCDSYSDEMLVAELQINIGVYEDIQKDETIAIFIRDTYYRIVSLVNVDTKIWNSGERFIIMTAELEKHPIQIRNEKLSDLLG